MLCNDEHYKVYETKEEWDEQARVFLIFGFVLGFFAGSLLVCEIWMLTHLFK